jgi:hypothetical protein
MMYFIVCLESKAKSKAHNNMKESYTTNLCYLCPEEHKPKFKIAKFKRTETPISNMMNRFLNSLIHCNNMAVASAMDTKRSTEMLRSGLIELKQAMREKEIADTDSHSIGDCSSGTANHGVSQCISIDAVPLASFCNDNGDCTATGGVFSFFHKALTVSINQTMTD